MLSAQKSRELVKEIKSGNEEVLLYLFKKHYADMKRIFSSYRMREKEIPSHVASMIVKIWMEIQRNDFSENIDLSSYLLNTARERAEKIVAERKASMKNKPTEVIADKSPQEIIAECVNVLDDKSRKLLQWRYAENNSMEQLAEKLKVDVMSVHDVLLKAFAQLASIVKIRMEYPS